jgi:hypothetical protein
MAKLFCRAVPEIQTCSRNFPSLRQILVFKRLFFGIELRPHRIASRTRGPLLGLQTRTLGLSTDDEWLERWEVGCFKRGDGTRRGAYIREAVRIQPVPSRICKLR